MSVSVSPASRLASATRTARSKGVASAKRQETLVGALMASPAVVLLVVFFLVPALLAFGLAFTNARLISRRPARLIGLDNFATLFTDSVFWASLRNTLYFAAVVVPVQAGLALVLALLVNAKVRGTNFFRTVYFLPVVTSMVVISLLWRFIYEPDGLLNHVISGVTLGHAHGTDWLNNPRSEEHTSELQSRGHLVCPSLREKKNK